MCLHKSKELFFYNTITSWILKITQTVGPKRMDDIECACFTFVSVNGYFSSNMLTCYQLHRVRMCEHSMAKAERDYYIIVVDLGSMFLFQTPNIPVPHISTDPTCMHRSIDSPGLQRQRVTKLV